MQIGPCGQRSSSGCDFIEDLNHGILPLAAKGTLVAVRPDRIIMHHAPGVEAGSLVRDCLMLMGGANSTANSVSITINEPPRLRA
ncbi:hypothetical protein D3C73_1481950 [compost metagenome]